jgi:diguanylate cyclase (GGDEF)-like protein
LALVLLILTVFIFSYYLHMHRVVVQGLQSMAENNLLVSQLKTANEKIGRLSRQDSLTGIANRRHFDFELDKSWRIQKRAQLRLALAMIDIDGFKLYNDNYGHPQGDQVLQSVAELIRRRARRPGDLAAQFGGEEFALILPGIHIQGAHPVAEDIHQALKELALPHGYSPVSDLVTVSIGLASLVPGDDNSVEQLLKMADQALYQAKQQGRNRSCEAPGSVASLEQQS